MEHGVCLPSFGTVVETDRFMHYTLYGLVVATRQREWKEMLL